MSDSTHSPAVRGGDELPKVDVSERAGERTGTPQVLHTRLFMQLLVFSSDKPGSNNASRLLGDALAAQQMPGVIYEDVNDPRGVGVLTWSEDPSHFITRVRPALQSVDRAGLAQRREFSMFGRTY